MAGPTVKAVVASVAVSIYRRHLGLAIRLLFDLFSHLHVKLPCPGDLYLPRTMGASGDCEIHALRATTSSSCGLRLAIRPPHHHHAHRRACLAGRPVADDGELLPPSGLALPEDSPAAPPTSRCAAGPPGLSAAWIVRSTPAVRSSAPPGATTAGPESTPGDTAPWRGLWGSRAPRAMEPLAESCSTSGLRGPTVNGELMYGGIHAASREPDID